jgi:hypothetical protein
MMTAPLSVTLFAVASLTLLPSCAAFAKMASMASASRIQGTALKYQSSVGTYYGTNNSEFYWAEGQQQQQQWQYQDEPPQQQHQRSDRIQGIFLGQEEDTVEQGYLNLASLSNIFSPSLSSSWRSPTASWPTKNGQSSYVRTEIYSPTPITATSTRFTTTSNQGFSPRPQTASGMLPASSSSSYSSYNQSPKSTGMVPAFPVSYSSSPSTSISGMLPVTATSSTRSTSFASTFPPTFFSPPREEEKTGMFVAASYNNMYNNFNNNNNNYKENDFPTYEPQIYSPPSFLKTIQQRQQQQYQNVYNNNYSNDDDDDMYYATPSQNYFPQPASENSSSAADRWHERQRRLTNSSLHRQEQMLTMNAFDHINFL